MSAAEPLSKEEMAIVEQHLDAPPGSLIARLFVTVRAREAEIERLRKGLEAVKYQEAFWMKTAGDRDRAFEEMRKERDDDRAELDRLRQRCDLGSAHTPSREGRTCKRCGWALYPEAP